MSRKVRLRDGTLVVIRRMTAKDVDRSFAFFESLSPEDRSYLRRNVSDKEVVKQRIRAMKSGNVKRLVALVDDRIVADAALEFEATSWKKHVAEVRLIVATAYQRKGLGMLMARELYSIATEANGFVFVSGQVALDPSTGERVTGGVRAEATRVMENIAGVLGDLGLGFDDVVKTTIFLADIGDFPEVNEVYAGYFADVPPARSTVQAGALPAGFLVEIETIAAR